MKISQAMIVKNEERCIERALSWAKEIAAEQIVVDTGSTDRTVEIARAMGAKVYEIPWEEDFAGAKNFAIEQCAGDWIMMLDADEWFPAAEVPLIPKILSDTKENMDGVRTRMVNVDEEGRELSSATHIRIFRNRPEIRYIGRIHEYIWNNQKTVLSLYEAADRLTILHDGYAPSIQRKKDLDDRNLRMIRRELEERPERLEMLGYLGDEYYARQDWAGAEKAYTEHLHQVGADDENLEGKSVYCFDLRAQKSFLKLLNVFHNEGKEEELVHCHKLACLYFPKDGDMDYILAWHYFYEKKNEAVAYFEKAFGKAEAYQDPKLHQTLLSDLKGAYLRYAEALLRAGRVAEARAIITELKKES